jgi:transcriptional regulator with XRE-family HTH domain
VTETDTTLRTVAHNVRAARLHAGLSLDELSRRAGVSKGALTALEKAQGNPNLTTLVRLADTLGISVPTLMQGPPEERLVRITTAETITPLWTGEHGGDARLVLVTSGPAPVEVWRWRLEPGDEHGGQPHQAGVVEIISVVSGRMTLVVDGTEHTVEAGQTATFRGDTSHTYRGAGDGTCHLIMTVQLPPTTT